MIDRIIEEFLKAVPWLFSGIGNKMLEKKQLNSSSDNLQFALENISQSEIEEIEEPYSVELGTRLKRLREDNLKLSKPKMRDFYEYVEVAELEKYEAGEVEFPKDSINKLKNFFFVNESFIEDGDSRIFRSINVYSEEVRELLKSGFKIKFLCSPFDREWLYTYPVFFKEEDDYMRIVVAGLVGSFMSSGGGYNNIATIIREMLQIGMESYEVSILKASEQAWRQLEHGTFYSTNPYFGLGQDNECQDIFEEWFRNLENKMYPERRESISNFYDAVFGNEEKNC